ncbi:MAG: hypothetical protein ACREEU_03520 [Acetobacteraceae bacterium]
MSGSRRVGIRTPAALLETKRIERGKFGRRMRFRVWFDRGFFNGPE